jgi:hypothetical protein
VRGRVDLDAGAVDEPPDDPAEVVRAELAPVDPREDVLLPRRPRALFV